MIARVVRRHSSFRKFRVLPDEEGPHEPRTFVAGGEEKKLDVAVSSPVSGLQVDISLKGGNFRDKAGRQFDKNLTGRTYELQDEARLIHEYQPMAKVIAVYFLPVGATTDKASGDSSFARTVLHLRTRTGRLDPSLVSHQGRLDAAAVALYVPGDDEPKWREHDSLARGVIRYFDVQTSPPRRGRPIVAATMDLAGLADWIARIHDPGAAAVEWGPAEPPD
jgi:hypothetical protein